MRYKWLTEVGATNFETWLQEKLYKPLEYFIYWRLNANFLTFVGPLPMLFLTLWVLFTGSNPPRIGPNGREGDLLSESFLLYFGIAMIFSSLIDAFDGNRARRQGCGSTFGGFFDCFMDGVAAYLETNIFLYLFNFDGAGSSYWN
jgi:phosphatidylglycerophosphate synthase